MLPTVTRFTALLLCLAILYNSMGYMVYFQALNIAVKTEAFSESKHIDAREFVYFTLPRHSTKVEISLNTKREIHIGSAMYDIVGEQPCGEKITYTCIRDNKEEKLLARARQLNDLSSPVQDNHIPLSAIADKIIKTALVSYNPTYYYFSKRAIFYPDQQDLQLLPYLAVAEHPPCISS